MLSVKAEQVASFLGKKITPQLAQEVGSRFSTRIEGTCIKHRLGQAQVKMYDKLGRILRIETTVNDVSFFKHHRKVEHRNGPSTRELAPLKKSIYSLIDLREILLGAIGATSNISPPWMTTAQAAVPSTSSPKTSATQTAQSKA